MEMFFVHFLSADRTVTKEVLASNPADAETKAAQLIAVDFPDHHWDDVVVNDVAKEKYLRER